MGDMANDMVDGTTCSICGLYFLTDGGSKETAKVFTHGYPAACKKCFRAGMRRDGIQKSNKRTL